MKKKLISIYINENQYRDLKELAKKEEETMSLLVRRAIKEYITKVKGDNYGK